MTVRLLGQPNDKYERSIETHEGLVIETADSLADLLDRHGHELVDHDLKRRLLYVWRRNSSDYPLGKKERRGLQRVRKHHPAATSLFVSERKGPLSSSSVRKIIARAGKHSRITFPVHPHTRWWPGHRDGGAADAWSLRKPYTPHREHEAHREGLGRARPRRVAPRWSAGGSRRRRRASIYG